MGLISLSYTFISSIALFACVLHFIVALRRKGDLTFWAGAILSFAIFINFTAMLLCGTKFGIECQPASYYRFCLVASQAIFICMLFVIVNLLGENKKPFFLVITAIFWIFLLASLLMPVNVLFGDDFSFRKITVPYDEEVMVINSGITAWRLMSVISTVIFVTSSTILLLNKWNRLNVKTHIALFIGVAFILFGTITDIFIDLRLVTISYTWPLAIFALYIVLIFIPFLNYVRVIINQELIIRKEKWYQHLINQADLIIVGLDRMGHVEFVNPFFCKLTGYTQHEVIGKDWFEFFIPPREFYNVQGTFIEILESGLYDQYINPVLTKNREEKLIRWYNIRTHDESGKTNGSYSVGLDVTDEISEKETLKQKLVDAEILIAKLTKSGI